MGRSKHRQLRTVCVIYPLNWSMRLPVASLYIFGILFRQVLDDALWKGILPIVNRHYPFEITAVAFHCYPYSFTPSRTILRSSVAYIARSRNRFCFNPNTGNIVLHSLIIIPDIIA